jgi:hypothetical protein
MVFPYVLGKIMGDPLTAMPKVGKDIRGNRFEICVDLPPPWFQERRSDADRLVSILLRMDEL